MFLSNKPTRLTTAAKSRLNAHSHKLDNIEPRKRSPDGNPGPPSPSEVIVFNNTNHSGGVGRSGQNARLPEVPQVEEIQRFLRETWDRKMNEIKTQKLTVLWIKSDREENMHKEGFHNAPGGSSQSNANPKIKNSSSPQHMNKK